MKGSSVNTVSESGCVWQKASQIGRTLNVSYKWIKKLAIRAGLTRIDDERLLIDAPAFIEWFNREQPKKWGHRRHDWIVNGHDKRSGVIYGLFDPINGKVRYIGKAVDTKNRLKSHRSIGCRKRHNTHLNKWINSVVADGRIVEMKILQECLPGMMNACEREWIAKGKAKGWKLCNSTDGGEGGEFSDSVKAVLSAKSKAKWADPEYVKNWDASFEKRWGYARGSKVVPEDFQRNKEARELRMALRAAHAKEKEDRKHWVFVPLTRGDTAFVPLTQGKWAMVDAESFNRVFQYNWSASKKGPSWRAKTNISKGVSCLLSRYIAEAQSHEMIFIRDGNQLNCRGNNLLRPNQTGGRPRP